MTHGKTATPFFQKIFVIFIATFAIMSAYELAKFFLAPAATGVRFDVLTILFATAIAVVIAWFPLRSSCRENTRTLAEMEKREEAERRLRKSEEQYRALIETTSTGYVILDPSGRVLDANPEYVRLTGRPELAEILGRPVGDWTADYEKEKNAAAIRECVEKGFIRNLEIDYADPGGNILPVEINATMVQGDDSPQILSICRDITDRRRAHEELLESEQKYRTMIENMQDLFYQTDPAGNLTMISPFGAKLAGYDSPEEMIGLNVAREIYADPHEREEFLATLKRDGRVTLYPITLKARDGTLHYLTASSQFFYDSKGNMKGVEGILHEITSLRLAENALKQANRQLTLMTSITRHDILNQLMALQAYVELTGKFSDNPEKILEFIGEQQKIVKNIENQIRFTRLYENMGIHAPGWQNVGECITRAVAELPVGDIAVSTQDPDIEVYADSLFEKVFYNLIDNALRYGGEKLTSVRISSQESGDELILACEDDGEGIRAEDKARLFERGFGKNTGLGLFLVREILAITGISIAERGVPGRGARFEIRVPKGEYRPATPK